jgi:hypothetical protein
MNDLGNADIPFFYFSFSDYDYRFRSLRTTSNLFIISLALADVLMSCIDFPLFAASSFLGYWPFGMEGECNKALP